ncbi:MAG: NAD(P)-dependent oxidoreductase [Erysipelotrichaceae bacterium]|nr:NAD(P)-dependent oxidoreductase [Erysipelotrichaceae bacterium]
MAFDPKITRKEQSSHPIKERINSFREVIIPFKEEDILEQAKRCLNCPNPQCVKGCPLSLPIPQMIELISKGEKLEAYKLINDVSPLSGICSIVCDHASQCEGHCIRNRKGEAVTIGAIHRYIAYLDEQYEFNFAKDNGKRVAIIGAGPSGLSASIELRKLGYQVTLYEREPRIGGVPYYGIPNFRLDDKELRKSYDFINKIGVDIRLNTEVSFNDILDQYDAIYLAIGTQKSKYMGIPGEDLEGVYTSEAFLKDIKVDHNYSKYEAYQNVIVVGGGNVAMDVSRTLVRLGKKTTIVYRRSIDEAPCRKDELEDAKEEGVILSFLTNPVKYEGSNKLEKATLIKMELGEPDESGRRSPVEIKGSEYTIPCDCVILAIGSGIEKEYINNIELNRNVVKVDNYHTSNPKVFAGGDVVTGSNTVVHAVKAGIEAAKEIDIFLSK